MSFVKVKVRASSKKDEVVKTGEDSFIITVRSEPKRGEANDSVISLLSSFLGIPASDLAIIKGRRSPSKIIFIREQKND